MFELSVLQVVSLQSQWNKLLTGGCNRFICVIASNVTVHLTQFQMPVLKLWPHSGNRCSLKCDVRVNNCKKSHTSLKNPGSPEQGISNYLGCQEVCKDLTLMKEFERWINRLEEEKAFFPKWHWVLETFTSRQKHSGAVVASLHTRPLSWPCEPLLGLLAFDSRAVLAPGLCSGLGLASSLQVWLISLKLTCVFTDHILYSPYQYYF